MPLVKNDDGYTWEDDLSVPDTSGTPFDQLLQNLPATIPLYNQGYTKDNETGEWSLNGQKLDPTAWNNPGYNGYNGFDPRLGPAYSSYGGNTDASWLSFAKKNGWNQDYTQATPQQQAQYNDYIKQFNPDGNFFGDALKDITQNFILPSAGVYGAVAGGAGLSNLLSGASSAAAGGASTAGAGLSDIAGSAPDLFPAGVDPVGGALTNSALGFDPTAIGSTLGAAAGGAAGASTGAGLSDLTGAPNLFPSDSGTAGALTGGAEQAPAPVQNGPTNPGSGPGGSQAPLGSSSASAGGSALSRLLSDNATAADLASLGGTAGSTLLGYLGAENQANSLSDNADKYLALGAPYRGLLAQSYDPSFNYGASPDVANASQQAMNDQARALSTKYGNPAESPTAQGELLTQAVNRNLGNLNTYRSQLGGFGQLGINTAGTNDTAAAQASGGTYDALGYGLSQLTNPNQDSQTLANLLKAFQRSYSPT